MTTVYVNDRPVSAAPNEMLLDVIRRAGIRVPTLCHLAGHTPTGSCRLCSVEVEGRAGLVPSCAFPASDGMRVQTHSHRALSARRTIVELLLASHGGDCNFCVRSGDCELQQLARELGATRWVGERPPRTKNLDLSSPSLVRDPDKCIACGRCVRVCEVEQSVGAIDFLGRGSNIRVGTAFDQGLNVSACVNCGQCILVCPTGALTEASQLPAVIAALSDPETIAVVQHAPAISVTLGEDFGIPPGRDLTGLLNAALRRLGFKWVFDTAFSADLTVMEEASELVDRLTRGTGPLPLITSCSPGWVKFFEQSFSDLLPHLSTCKSPQQMMGAITKSYFAELAGIDPSRVFMVSIMPCTAKKFEALRPEMMQGQRPDVDAVLTTRELIQWIRRFNLDLPNLPPEPADDPFGRRSSSGKIFGVSGGVMEAALRTAHHLLTGREFPDATVPVLRGKSPIRRATVTIGETELRVAAVSGLAHARQLMTALREGREQLHFIEVMACPGGCIAGGGQPIGRDAARMRARARALYTTDKTESLRLAHHNASVQKLYRDFLGEPLGSRSHELLHTRYCPREAIP